MKRASEVATPNAQRKDLIKAILSQGGQIVKEEKGKTAHS